MGGVDPGRKPEDPVPQSAASGKKRPTPSEIWEIPAKTYIYALTTYTVSSQTHKPGDKIDLILHEPIMVDGVAVVNRGAPIQAVVEAVTVDDKNLVREAFILRLDSLQVQPNRWIPLRSNFLARVGPVRPKVEKEFEVLRPEFPAIYPTGSRLEFWLVEPAQLKEKP